MNRSMTYTYTNTRTAAPRRRTSARPLTAGERFVFFLWMLQQFFAQPQVKMFLRLMAGGTAFMTMLGIVGGIECGRIDLLPGLLCCAALVLTAFLLFRRLADEA